MRPRIGAEQISLHRGDQLADILRQRCFPVHILAGARVWQAQPPGVQRLSRERAQLFDKYRLGPGWYTIAATVHRVADQWTVQMLHMHANLMSATAFEFQQ
jgi:hypothetical protein